LTSFYKEEGCESVGDGDKAEEEEEGNVLAVRFKTIEEEDEGKVFMTNNVGVDK